MSLATYAFVKEIDSLVERPESLHSQELAIYALNETVIMSLNSTICLMESTRMQHLVGSR